MDWLVDVMEKLVDAFEELGDFLDDVLGVDVPGPLLLLLVLGVILYVAKSLLNPR